MGEDSIHDIHAVNTDVSSYLYRVSGNCLQVA